MSSLVVNGVEIYLVRGAQIIFFNQILIYLSKKKMRAYLNFEVNMEGKNEPYPIIKLYFLWNPFVSRKLFVFEKKLKKYHPLKYQCCTVNCNTSNKMESRVSFP